MIRVVTDQEFLHTKKINNKDVYVEYGATEDIQSIFQSRRQYYRWRFDSILLKQVDKVLKVKGIRKDHFF